MRKIDLNNCVVRSTKLAPIDKDTPNKLYYDSKLECSNLLIGSKGSMDSTKVLIDGKEVNIKGVTMEVTEENVFVLLQVLEGDEIVVKSLEFK